LTAVCLSDGFCCLVGATFSVGQAIKTKTQGGGAVFCGWRYMWVAAFGHKLSPVEAKSNREPPGLVVCGKWRLLGESFGWIRAKYLLV